MIRTISATAPARTGFGNLAITAAISEPLEDLRRVPEVLRLVCGFLLAAVDFARLADDVPDLRLTFVASISLIHDSYSSVLSVFSLLFSSVETFSELSSVFSEFLSSSFSRTFAKLNRYSIKRLISLTPDVILPRIEISEHCRRIMIPSVVIIMISFSSLTAFAPITLPVFSVSCSTSHLYRLCSGR